MTTKHELLAMDDTNILQVTTRGQEFLDNQHPTIAEIDEYEGVLNILQLVAERGPGKRSDFLNEYVTYCRAFTSYRSETVIKHALYARLVNLIDRSYVARKAQIYQITDAGLTHLDKSARLIPDRATKVKQSELVKLTKDISKEARIQLAEYLAQMNPFKFEELIKLLLEEMGYTNVETTSPTNDKGVDVVGDIELGISRVREVIQVKRHKTKNIDRPVLDALRGSLHRFKAVRGTIITIGKFSRGTELAAFETGAAPITLIDGDKLLDLLIEYGIGVAKKSVEYFEFDSSKLVQFESKEADETAV